MPLAWTFSVPTEETAEPMRAEPSGHEEFDVPGRGPVDTGVMRHGTAEDSAVAP